MCTQRPRKTSRSTQHPSDFPASVGVRYEIGGLAPNLSPFCFHVRSVCEELFLPHHQKERPELWFYSKILELLSHALLEPLEDFCTHRKERLALERIESVKKNLTQNLEYPPSLQECARNAGCSPSYLSRTFTLYTGITISRYLRNIRLERAATLLRSGKYNVTEAAMAVGYSSLSHFSKAFAEMFGSCPCAFGFYSGTSSKEGIGAITASPKSVSPR
ncbi:MAG: AraC family transcriptional regulator [Chthoniobacterales bacterium]|nr:AraC family transcriptional regulator [Chthoniobacterales bacterium]